jgi:small subunit ribosomal protein S3
LGRKVHPTGFRLGITKDHQSRWYAEGKEYGDLVIEDDILRRYIRKENPASGISKIEIERVPAARDTKVTIHTAKPGIIIGRKGANVNLIREKLQELTGGKKVHVDVKEIENPDTDAYLIGESIGQQLEKRISHKRAMKQAVRRAIRAGAKGIMITCSGRLSGSDMARRESTREGQIPRHTLRADIDFAQVEALTTYSKIGIKVWVYKGEILPEIHEEVEGTYAQ